MQPRYTSQLQAERLNKTSRSIRTHVGNLITIKDADNNQTGSKSMGSDSIDFCKEES